MNRQQKEAVVADFKRLFTESNAAFLIGYKGLSVSQMQDLRASLRESDAKLRIAKARLMKIAAKDMDGMSTFSDMFRNQVGLVFAKNEVPPVAKSLVGFAKNIPSLEVLSALFESRLLSKQDIDFLASLPSKDVLLAQVVGTIQAPISCLARLLNAMLLRLLYCLKEIESKKS